MVSSDKYAPAFAGTLPKPHKPTLNQSFAKEPASRPDKEKKFLKMPLYNEWKKREIKEKIYDNRLKNSTKR